MATISQYAHISVDELREALQGGFSSSGNLESTLASVCNKASDAVDRFLDREVVTRGSRTVYISPPGRTSRLYLAQWPVTAVSSVYEDAGRTYATALVANTDYIVTKPADDHGYLTRVFANASLSAWAYAMGDPMSGGGFWLPAFRSVKVTYTAGYTSTATVPDAIKFETLKLAVKMWGEWKAGASDIGTETGPMGHVSRLSSAYITDRMKEALYPFKRPSPDVSYEERDA